MTEFHISWRQQPCDTLTNSFIADTPVLWLLQALCSSFYKAPWHFGASIVLETNQVGMDTTWPVLLCLSISHWFQRMVFTCCRKKLPQWDVRAGLPCGAWVETWGPTTMSALGSCFKASFLISILRLLFYDQLPCKIPFVWLLKMSPWYLSPVSELVMKCTESKILVQIV